MRADATTRGPEVLTREQVAAYRRDGCIFPIDVMPASEAARFFDAFGETERSAWGMAGRAHDDAAGREWLRRPHHFHRWAFDLCAHQRLVAAVADLLGPDILLWDAKLFPKPARSRSFVSWHQDATYVGLRPLDKVLTVWLALTDADEENGAMSFLPGSHRIGQRAHEKTFAEANLLSRGQVVADEVDPAQARTVVLRAGQASAHHMHLVHGSPPNLSARPRVGLSINYVTPDVVETGNDPRPAVLVKGVDAYRHFAPLQVPT
jgi:non-haem Fe2+, alpha-ketoglutarate-dependent halogenase